MIFDHNDIQLIDSFAEDAYLNKTHDPYFRKRLPGAYAEVIISDCQSSSWWYAKYIGVECLVQLHFLYKTNFIKDVEVVRLINSKVHHGRSIDPRDIIIK